jgi:hypothetical protein
LVVVCVVNDGEAESGPSANKATVEFLVFEYWY